MKSCASSKANRNNEESGKAEDSILSDLTWGSYGKRILSFMIRKLDQLENNFSYLLSSENDEIASIMMEINSLKQKVPVQENYRRQGICLLSFF